MRNISTLLAVLAMTAGLAACGTTTSDRAISGAGLGAAGGAAVGALTGGSVAGGALIGAAAGGATGALTNKDQINAGKPVWR